MAGLQRSSETFRRSGSSGLVWEDMNLPDQMNTNTTKPKEQDGDAIGLKQSQSVGAVGLMKRNRSTGGGGGGGTAGGTGVKAFRTDQVAPAMDPPSPKVSCCGFCGEFSKAGLSKKGKARRR